LSAPDPAVPEGARLPGLDARPGFEEPWQADLLAIADRLVARGLFTAAAWSEALGAALRAADAADRPDDQQTYYVAALAALERLTTQAGIVTTENLDRRQAQWRRAHEATPHGDPVRLEAGAET